jgi:hypothetical protein
MLKWVCYQANPLNIEKRYEPDYNRNRPDRKQDKSLFKDWRLGTLLRQSNIKSVVAPILNLNQATNND